MDLAKEATISLVQNPLAAGTSDVATGYVDVSGHRAVTFILVIGAQDAAADVELKLQQSDGVNPEEDIPGAVALAPVNSDNKLLTVETRKATKTFVRGMVTRGGTGNTTTGGVIAILHEPRVTPSEVPASQAVAPVSA
jgi:hypothetical protein